MAICGAHDHDRHGWPNMHREVICAPMHSRSTRPLLVCLQEMRMRSMQRLCKGWGRPSWATTQAAPSALWPGKTACHLVQRTPPASRSRTSLNAASESWATPASPWPCMFQIPAAHHSSSGLTPMAKILRGAFASLHQPPARIWSPPPPPPPPPGPPMSVLLCRMHLGSLIDT